MGVGANSEQLSFTGTELYRFEVPIGRHANFYKKFELMLTGRVKAYSSSCPQAVTHRSTNRARHRVTSLQPKRVTNDVTPQTPVP